MNQCPNCGYCPCCGRGRQHSYPQFYSPYQYPQYTTYGTSGLGATLKDNQTTATAPPESPKNEFDYSDIQNKLDSINKCKHNQK